MEMQDILNYCINKYSDTVLAENWGEKGVFYNPKGVLKKGIYILTIKQKDGNNDKASNLNRENIFRLNIGIKKKSFEDLFGETPKRPQAGEIIDMNYDFSATDKIMPHPIYAWMDWICVISPSDKTFEKLKPFINESYEYAKEKFKKRK